MLDINEVADVLRRALRGEIKVSLAGGRNWDDTYCGNVAFRFGDWKITFFNDCGELDYTDTAEAPDGSSCGYEEWNQHDPDGSIDPLYMLSKAEFIALERLVESIS